MSRISRVIVVDDDNQSRATLAFGFEREGVAVHKAAGIEAALGLLEEKKGEAVVASLDGTAGCLLTKQVRARRAGSKLPVLVLGSAPMRRAVLEAGASDFLHKPAFVQDVITLIRLLCLKKPDGAGSSTSPVTWLGELREFPSLFHLVRALSAAQRTGVMTLVRGLRRGELRFFEGEVTSAQVGMLHGMAALHQLLLWPEARFELRSESVVRRQQIPLPTWEILEEAGRFLCDFEEIARGLAPGSVFEQDLRRVAECAGKIPREVGPVLRLFDGVRTLADIIEDSPFRINETVTIAHRLLELGAIKRASLPRPKAGARAALSVIDDWLVGGAPQAPMRGRQESGRVGPLPGQPAAPPPLKHDERHGVGSSDKTSSPVVGREMSGAASMGAVLASPEMPPVTAGVPVPLPDQARSAAVDWTGLTSALGAPSPKEAAGFSQVIPSRVVAGEIQVGAGAAGVVAGSIEVKSVVPQKPEGLLMGATRDPLEKVLAQQDAQLRIASNPKSVVGPPAGLESLKARKTTEDNGRASVSAPLPVTEVLAPVAPTPISPPAPNVASPAEQVVVAPSDTAVAETPVPRATSDNGQATHALALPQLDTVTPIGSQAAEVARGRGEAPKALPEEGGRTPSLRAKREAIQRGAGERPPLIEATQGRVGNVPTQPFVESKPGPAPGLVPSPDLSTVAAAPNPETPKVLASQSPTRAPENSTSVGDLAQSVRAGGLFNEIEEEFFRKETEFEKATARPAESFEDLDAGASPAPSFWQRLFGVKPRPFGRQSSPRPSEDKPSVELPKISLPSSVSASIHTTLATRQPKSGTKGLPPKRKKK
ncbi:MAG: response regulator [Deltaproteobacteria bacterium]|nr:response regulator [Deltaproteobacteria bacterium]